MKAKYEAPKMEIISIETTTLLAGSGDIDLRTVKELDKDEDYGNW